MVDGTECSTMLDRSWRSVRLEQRREQAAVELGVEDGDSDPLRGEDIGVRARCSFDQSVKTETTQVKIQGPAGQEELAVMRWECPVLTELERLRVQILRCCRRVARDLTEDDTAIDVIEVNSDEVGLLSEGLGDMDHPFEGVGARRLVIIPWKGQ
jgi:hypothetical protein